MYRGPRPGAPRRVVCLSADSAELAHAVGAGERVVGVPGTVVRPEAARAKARVGGFTTFRLDRILALEPDLVVAFSDLQAGIAAELIGAGVAVLCTNPRTLDEVLDAMLVVGRALDCGERAAELVDDLRTEIAEVREFSRTWTRRPRVYFEEWPDPLVAGIAWISDAIVAAGGEDVFRELARERGASGRRVAPALVPERDPEVILASWCGRPLDPAVIRARPGWERVTAVRAGRIHEIPGEDILVPGPSLGLGLRRIHELVQAAQSDG